MPLATGGCSGMWRAFRQICVISGACGHNAPGFFYGVASSAPVAVAGDASLLFKSGLAFERPDLFKDSFSREMRFSAEFAVRRIMRGMRASYRANALKRQQGGFSSKGRRALNPGFPALPRLGRGASARSDIAACRRISRPSAATGSEGARVNACHGSAGTGWKLLF